MSKGRSVICVLLLLAFSHVQAGEIGLTGQVSTWAMLTDDDPEGHAGGRYIGEVSLSADLSPKWQLRGEAAFDAHGYGSGDSPADADWDGDVDPYRLWLRLASPQSEVRAGLQKISFGSATLLRPLMWFDTLDPRDPLQLTDGVYGLLGRYTFLNNVNIWLWALYGNDDLRGWETVPTDDDDIEGGGRVQMPLGTGEAGLSYHHRRADPLGVVPGEAYPQQDIFAEDRFGIDCKWDVCVGLWFEGAVTRQDLELPQSRYRRQFTVGSDYTFGVGNGVHLLGEHFIESVAEDVLDDGESVSISAFSCDYPLGLFDTLAAFVYYDWEGDAWSPLLQWRRIYDQWQIHASAFYSEGQARSDALGPEAGFTGTGASIMFVFDH